MHNISIFMRYFSTSLLPITVLVTDKFQIAPHNNGRTHTLFLGEERAFALVYRVSMHTYFTLTM